MLAEQHDEWTEGRRYIGFEVLARARAAVNPDTTSKEVPTDSVPALSA